jgi:YcxB-like protein
MLTVSYTLTPQDLTELDAEARGGWSRRILGTPVRGLLGGLGLVVIWQACFFFPREHWFGNPAIACFGTFLLWMALDWPGLRWANRRFSDPTAVSQVSFLDGKLVLSSRGKTQQLRWFPESGFKENEKFFLLRTPENGRLAIPKRAFSLEQERSFRELLQREQPGDSIDCHFVLTQAELAEATVARHPRIGTKTGKSLLRAACAGCVLLILWLPAHVGTSWMQIFRNEPAFAAGLLLIAAWNLWSSAGSPGLNALNRLDQERRVRLNNLGVEVTLSGRTSTHPWRRFSSYQETQNFFLFSPQRIRFSMIPKKALQPQDEEKLRALLESKLPRTSGSRI